ncbi:hypothetical protein [uncultured Thermosynechococcus sp.]|uniref:hypothetical protein n=1 Tax=uncultured Thermosynechococcus sp. TaxID=436945 RepID=UPI00261292AF|nr:hypothetical protein [uncultured Thermosynechococcus sp.]
MAKARRQLPATEVLLIGKPPSGKSSIVRAIAGAEAGIVRAGFRPLRQQPQRYGYSTMLVCLRHRES